MSDNAITNKIAEWIKDEASKELPDGYICIIGGDAEKAARETMVKERFILRQYARTPEFFLRIGFVRNFLERKAIKQGKAFFEEMIGECLLVELDDIDAILLYPDRLLYFYNNFLKEAVSVKPDMVELENMARDFTRHECRHACQFVELRKLGIDPSDILDQEYTEFTYGEGPLETDAFLYQFHETEQSVTDVCLEIVENIFVK